MTFHSQSLPVTELPLPSLVQPLQLSASVQADVDAALDVGASQWLDPLFRRHSLLSLLHSQSPAVTGEPLPSVAQLSQPSALQPGPAGAMAVRARHKRRIIDLIDSGESASC